MVWADSEALLKMNIPPMRSAITIKNPKKEIKPRAIDRRCRWGFEEAEERESLSL